VLLFLAKALIVLPYWLAMLVWAFVKVPASECLFQQHAIISGSYFSWTWLQALNSSVGIYAIVNIPDITVRPPYTNKRYLLRITLISFRDWRRMSERDSVLFYSQYIQLFIIPVAFTLYGFIGIAVTSAGVVLYGQILWNPLTTGQIDWRLSSHRLLLC
jgi:nucleobase:cation symporter-1, NCS1 family